jgi:hypothetical protein
MINTIINTIINQFQNMPRENSLAVLSYLSLPPKTFIALSNAQSPSDEKVVYDMIKEEYQKNHTKFSKWYPSSVQISSLLYQIYLYSQFVLSTDYKSHSMDHYWESFISRYDIVITSNGTSSSFSKSEEEKRMNNSGWSKKQWMISETFHLIFRCIFNHSLYKNDLEKLNTLIDDNNKKHCKEQNRISEEDMKFLKRLNIRDKTYNQTIPFQIYIILNKSFCNKRLFMIRDYYAEDTEDSEPYDHIDPVRNMKTISKKEMKTILKSMKLYFLYIRKNLIKSKPLDFDDYQEYWDDFTKETRLTDFITPVIDHVTDFFIQHKLKFGDDYMSPTSLSSESRKFSGNYAVFNTIAEEKAVEYCNKFPSNVWTKMHWIVYHCFMLMVKNISNDKKGYLNHLEFFSYSQSSEIPKTRKLQDAIKELKVLKATENIEKNLIALYTFLDKHADKENIIKKMIIKSEQNYNIKWQ